MKPVCLVIGAGAGIGGTVGKKFAQEGYHAVLCRRSNQEGLRKLVGEIEGEGGSATGYLLNAVDENSIEDRVAAVEAEIGPIEAVVFNLGAQIGNRALADTSYKMFEVGWRMATFALFRLASTVFPRMEERGKGTLSRRSNGWAAHAVPEPQRRVRAEGHPCRAYVDRRCGRRAGHTGQDAWARGFPKASRNAWPRKRWPASAEQNCRDVLPRCAAASLCLDPRTRSSLFLRPGVVEPQVKSRPKRLRLTVERNHSGSSSVRRAGLGCGLTSGVRCGS